MLITYKVHYMFTMQTKFKKIIKAKMIENTREPIGVKIVQ